MNFSDYLLVIKVIDKNQVSCISSSTPVSMQKKIITSKDSYLQCVQNLLKKNHQANSNLFRNTWQILDYERKVRIIFQLQMFRLWFSKHTGISVRPRRTQSTRNTSKHSTLQNIIRRERGKTAVSINFLRKNIHLRCKKY